METLNSAVTEGQMTRAQDARQHAFIEATWKPRAGRSDLMRILRIIAAFMLTSLALVIGDPNAAPSREGDNEPR
jgi:hypothetical protein